MKFADKWKQAIGQALWYAMQTGKQARIVVILEDPVKDAGDAIRLQSVIAEHSFRSPSGGGRGIFSSS